MPDHVHMMIAIPPAAALSSSSIEPPALPGDTYIISCDRCEDCTSRLALVTAIAKAAVRRQGHEIREHPIQPASAVG